jgi:hypothetical protein
MHFAININHKVFMVPYFIWHGHVQKFFPVFILCSELTCFHQKVRVYDFADRLQCFKFLDPRLLAML